LLTYTPNQRVAFAIALSALLHAAILWLPQIQLPHAKVKLAQLTVRIEHLPEIRKPPAEKPKPASPITAAGAADKQATGTKPAKDKMPVMGATAEPVAPLQFPKHLLLTYAVYRNGEIFKSGEIQQQLDISGDRYTLRATKWATGLTGLRKNAQLIQTSRGKIVAQGLHPETFQQEEFGEGGNQSLKAEFDWAAQKLRFSSGDDTALPADAQDMLSFMYQLSQLSMHTEFFPLPVSDGAKLENFQIEVGMREEISAPLGKLLTQRLRKMHERNEPYFEIWLGLEYRLLPVKFSRVDSSGKVTEEFVISDIRAADKP